MWAYSMPHQDVTEAYGQEACNDIFRRIPLQETVNEVQINDFRDGVTSVFMGIDGETLLIFNIFSFISLIIF